MATTPCRVAATLYNPTHAPKKNRWETYKNWVIWLDEKDPVFVIKCSHRPSATSNFQQ
jgi:hypothetical protein